MKIKAIGFVAIPVTDIARARKFYEDVLGLEVAEEMMSGKWIEYAVGDDTLAIANVGEHWTPSDQGTRSQVLSGNARAKTKPHGDGRRVGRVRSGPDDHWRRLPSGMEALARWNNDRIRSRRY